MNDQDPVMVPSDAMTPEQEAAEQLAEHIRERLTDPEAIALIKTVGDVDNVAARLVSDTERGSQLEHEISEAAQEHRDYRAQMGELRSMVEQARHEVAHIAGVRLPTYDETEAKNQEQMPRSEGERPLSLKEQVRVALDSLNSSLDSIKTEDQVEETALELLDQHPEGAELLARIKEGQKYRREDPEARARRGELFEKIKLEVALYTGVEIDAIEHTRQRNEYRLRLQERVADIDPNQADEETVLLTLGMIQKDGEGNVRFHMPDDLFPPYVRELWETYTEIFTMYNAAVGRRNAGIGNNVDEIAQYDLARKRAHNSVAKAIGEFLDFDGWTLTGEDGKDGPRTYRRLVEKMLNERFPTRETDEIKTTGRAARDFIAEIKALAKHGMLN